MTTNSLTPTLKSHLEAQCHFMAELSRKLLDTAQGLNALNMRLAQELIGELTAANAHLLAARGSDEVLSLMVGHVQPGVDKLQHYQQQLSDLLASANLDLKTMTDMHVPATQRTATAFADEMVRQTLAETEKAAQLQRGLLEQMQFSTQGSNGADIPPPQAQ